METPKAKDAGMLGLAGVLGFIVTQAVTEIADPTLRALIALTALAVVTWLGYRLGHNGSAR